MPKDVQQDKTRARLRRADEPARLSTSRIRKARPEQIKPDRRGDQAAPSGRSSTPAAASSAAKPATSSASSCKKTGIPVTMTVMGLGALPGRRPAVARHARHARHVYANYAVDEADLLIALGVRFDDRVTGKVEEFAKHGKIVHVDIDASELNKNKPAHIPVVQRREVRPRRAEQDRRGARRTSPTGSSSARSGRRTSRSSTTRRSPASCSSTRSATLWRAHAAIATPIVTVGVGQHQMWAAQFYKFNQPRTLALQQRPGHDGLRPARRDGRAGRSSRTRS